MESDFKRGTHVMILESANVPKDLRGKIGYISGKQCNGKECKYKFNTLTTTYVINPSICDAIVSEDDISII